MTTGHDGSEYTVLARKDGRYGVEVQKPSDLPRFEEGFMTKEEAEQWIFDQISAGSPQLPPFAGPPDSVPGRGY